jgi:AbrB family looped-hinge helix DNA binding protein
MRATVDKAGRVVIPKKLRDDLGLAAGVEVEVTADGPGLRIEAVAGSLAENDGFLVIPAGAAGALSDDDVRDLRLADQR